MVPYRGSVPHAAYRLPPTACGPASASLAHVTWASAACYPLVGTDWGGAPLC